MKEKVSETMEDLRRGRDGARCEGAMRQTGSRNDMYHVACHYSSNTNSDYTEGGSVVVP